MSSVRPRPLASVRVLVLIGFPGCGKSSFADAIVAACGEDAVARVNRDVHRDKGEVDRIASRAASSPGACLIVDACNLTLAHRRRWVDWVAGGTAWAVFFDVDLAECRERALRRARTGSHPTLRTEEDVRRALAGIESSLVPPTTAEGFARIEVVSDDADADALLHEWGCARTTPLPSVVEPGDLFVKFPRTPHLLDLGSATRGDKLLSAEDMRRMIGSGSTVYVSEKVDGANLGMWIGADGRVRVQNRGHLVDSSYHEQFKPLDKWVARHMGDLWTVLQADEHPERFVLFGEWVYAKHSVPYTRLPDLFLAFDVYDRQRDAFLDRELWTAWLKDTSIAVAPLVAHRPLASLDEAKALVAGPSAFGDAPREGVVFTLCRDGVVQARAKLVRPSFADALAAGRWNRGHIVPNGVI